MSSDNKDYAEIQDLNLPQHEGQRCSRIAARGIHPLAGDAERTEILPPEVVQERIKATLARYRAAIYCDIVQNRYGDEHLLDISMR